MIRRVHGDILEVWFNKILENHFLDMDFFFGT
jgi:hypothetical protein